MEGREAELVMAELAVSLSRSDEELLRKIWTKGTEEEVGLTTRIKVQDGTPRSDLKSLCLTCHSSSIVKGRNLEYMIYCHTFERNVSFPVVECSSYSDKRQPSIHDMQKIAWNVETRGKRGAAGFSDSVKEDGTETREIEITPPKQRPGYEPDYE